LIENKVKSLNFNYFDLQSDRSLEIKPIILGACIQKRDLINQDSSLTKIGNYFANDQLTSEEKRPFWIVLDGGKSRKFCTVK
jgi:hypothetical protein